MRPAPSAEAWEMARPAARTDSSGLAGNGRFARAMRTVLMGGPGRAKLARTGGGCKAERLRTARSALLEHGGNMRRSHVKRGVVLGALCLVPLGAPPAEAAQGYQHF